MKWKPRFSTYLFGNYKYGFPRRYDEIHPTHVHTFRRNFYFFYFNFPIQNYFEEAYQQLNATLFFVRIELILKSVSYLVEKTKDVLSMVIQLL